ncbi:NAD(P)-binding protein [Lophium mytilinum]|uniref:NAD(P)-binding protein n=1 Tax=Lophium mytilinum TaxID=390894 RepID=A0A6A6QJ19_9PEZI|nr:NAD(P)-binding protein [Lophium mytilinum]
MSSPKTALVLRATGAQGRGAVSHLLAHGWRVHALVRDPTDARALSLEKLGAKLFKGSLSTPSLTNTAPSTSSSTITGLDAAIAGCTALFLAQMPNWTPGGEAAEGAAILAAAQAAGVQHVVHATTLSLNDPEHAAKMAGTIVAPAVLGKGEVEELVKASGITYTILRPGWFMTNLTLPLVGAMFPQLVAEGRFVHSYGEGCVLPLVDPDDVGAFAAAAVEDPARFGGRTIAVAGEKLGIAEILKEIEKVGGKEFEIVARTAEEIERTKGEPIVAGSC